MVIVITNRGAIMAAMIESPTQKMNVIHLVNFPNILEGEMKRQTKMATPTKH